jgi:hypothetical protein
MPLPTKFLEIFANGEWNGSAAASWVIRFIFMGNQPFFANGEAMEVPAGDAGSWTLMSCSIFYEFGNGEMDCQLGGSRGILEFNPFIYYTLL